ncbi:AMP-binding protein [Hoeflea sp. WL0058]|uniref:AMP-binding protein n=1 Tax=Flavimaribacter sediminis TaxID=2865987 RepID=A0AAE2ZKN4_9HYPH|nr:AMP-binding protein [Flavimaribacter sediminis]MBW8636330.1 AMP-binding protein [Flavimaribacter sediminis]
MEKVIESDFVSIDDHDTLAKLFRGRVREWGDRIAMREKDLGVWQSFTWKEFDDHARGVAGGLMALGLGRGDVVSVLSEDNKEWAFADMGCHMAGCIVNGIYPTYQHGQALHMLADSRTRVLIVEDEEQLDKYLQVRNELPDLIKVYVIDWKGLRGFHDPMVEPIGHLYELGAQYRRENPGRIDSAIDAGQNGDTAVLIYTSGTTGAPKGALISHRYLLFQMTAAPDPYPVGHDDDMLTYLPLCHVAERVVSLCMSLATGVRLNFAESAETVFQNIQELSPTVLFAVPRIWEKFYSRVATMMAEATWLGRKGYEWALKVGHARAEYLLEGRAVPAGIELQYRLADWLVYRNIKQLLGLDRAHFLMSGAAPISADLLNWYLAIGLPVTELYGQTEIGLATMTSPDRPQPGTIGKPLPGVSVRLGEQGEILVKSPSLFSGYLNNEEATANTIIDGWVHTGDVGAMNNEGTFRITDRIKDIIITAGGKNITPSLIENQLKFSPYISDAIVIGDKRKYLTCLVMIDQENVEHYAQSKAIPFTNYRSLCARPEIVALIDKEITKANEKFASVEQVKKFRLIDVLLTPEDEEVTPTMKLKRSFVAEKYATLVGEMYQHT